MQALFAGGPRSIHRQFTMCKARPGNLQQTNALPFVFDLTLALVTDIQPPSFVQSSMDEVVFQATLQVSSGQNCSRTTSGQADYIPAAQWFISCSTAEWT